MRFVTDDDPACPDCGGSGMTADPDRFGEPTENVRECETCSGSGLLVDEP